MTFSRNWVGGQTNKQHKRFLHFPDFANAKTKFRDSFSTLFFFFFRQFFFLRWIRDLRTEFLMLFVARFGFRWLDFQKLCFCIFFSLSLSRSPPPYPAPPALFFCFQRPAPYTSFIGLNINKFFLFLFFSKDEMKIFNHPKFEEYLDGQSLFFGRKQLITKPNSLILN